MKIDLDEVVQFVMQADEEYGIALAEGLNRLRADLAQERKRLDWALMLDSFYDHTTHVFHCDPAFKIVNPQVRIETDNPRSTIDELMGDKP